MSELIKDITKAAYRFITHRILWLFVITAILFCIMLAQLFELAIVIPHSTFTAPPRMTATVQQTIPAPRGNIYDRFGRPLAINITVFVATMDPTVPISNEALLELARLFERNGEDYVNRFPMTGEWPYEFTLGGSTAEIRKRREFRWKDDMAIPNPAYATAAESFLYLRGRQIPGWPKVDPELCNEDARRILNLRTMIFERRFRPQIFVIATDISPATAAAIEEQRHFFTGVEIGTQTMRVYPQGRYFSHILGYLSLINAAELAANPDYAHDDLIGRTGLERSMESHLRGINGTQLVEIDPSTGRRVGTLPQTTPPVPGSNVFLTVDAAMQARTYYILKEYLTEIAVRRIQGGNPREPRVTYRQIFSNLIRAGWVPVRDIFDTEEGTAACTLRRYVLARFPEATALHEDRERVVDILTAGINAGRITPADMFTAMVELEILSDYNNFAARARAGHSTNALIIEKLRMGELTPQMINIDPSTGSVVVVDVRTGAVLAAVSYPSYDNNRLTFPMDGEYFARINSHDPTHPMINRPFMEPRAPGSTFKMITALAGLDTGVIGPATVIHDGVVFTRAGRPTARCMSSVGHGRINVVQGIFTSCNYFFYETSFRLCSTTRGRIEILNRYMEFFGLNQRSGVEIWEFADTFDAAQNIMASPQLKQFLHTSRDMFAPPSQWSWFDGDTIRTAIGQSYNNYTAAMMVRYIAQIANNGVRLPLHLVGSIENCRGRVLHLTTPVPEYTGMEISGDIWELIQYGMLQATRARGGTATAHFRNFPIQVAGKTGTAEQIGTRLSHTSFGGFAPFDDPQIAIYVTIPFGATGVMPSASAQVARDVIYAFLMPDGVEHPVSVNTLTR